MGREIGAVGVGEADDGVLDEVVVGIEPVVRGVVGGGAVGHLDEQPARTGDEEGEGVAGGDEVRVERQPHHAQALLDGRLPHRLVPFDQPLAAPDVVDEDVEPAGFARDPIGEGSHGRFVQVIGDHRDAAASGGRDEVGRVLDRLRAALLGWSETTGAAGAPDRRPGGPEFDGDAASGAACRPRDERNAPTKIDIHRQAPASRVRFRVRSA